MGELSYNTIVAYLVPLHTTAAWVKGEPEGIRLSDPALTTIIIRLV